ncbi:unnamed protein product [Symbiodinium sp. CCMP2592]|nr:unnamed protein product [Symbiodinium sp. CCMP2592]
MALTVPASGRLPRSTAPPEAADKHELKAVLAAQESEMHAMKAQLAETQRECNRLKHKLRDVETELQVAKEVTASATHRLTAHAERKDLLLSAGVERGGLERAKLEEELQRMERLLWERDQEIKKLRHTAGNLEKNQLQLDLEMRGLHAAKETSTLEAKELSTGIADLLHSRLQKVPSTHSGFLDSMASSNPFSTQNLDAQRQREEKRLKESTQRLELKRQEHAELKHRANQAAADAKKMEEEDAALHHRVQLFEQQLREKQGQMELHDKKFVHEGGLLREHVEELRKAVAKEQTSFMAADHCAVLHSQVQDEAKATKQEIQSLLAIVLQLDSALRARHQHVHSAEAFVISDSPPGVSGKLCLCRRLVDYQMNTRIVWHDLFAGLSMRVNLLSCDVEERKAGTERYCILCCETFQYYTSAKDFKQGKAPLVTFPLRATSSFEASPTGSDSCHGARVILLEGHGEDVALWCQALEEAFGTARTRGSELELQILGFDGQLCRVLAEPAWRVRDLKAVIHSATHIPPSEQRLVFRTELLDDRDLLQGVLCTDETVLPSSAENALELHLVRCPPVADMKPAGLQRNREDMLQAVRNNWQQLGEAEAAWRRDREVVLAAVCQEQSPRNRQAGWSKSEEARSICSSQDCMALQFASEELREDPEIILAATRPHRPSRLCQSPAEPWPRPCDSRAQPWDLCAAASRKIQRCSPWPSASLI